MAMVTTGVLMILVYFVGQLALQQQEKYHTGTVRPKLLVLGLGMCTRVHRSHFGPTGACRGLLGQFLWPRAHTVLYCTCTWIFPWNLEYRTPVKNLSLSYFT